MGPVELLNRFACNGLRVGREVVVCEHRAPARRTPRRGAVAFVAHRRTDNDVGVRLDDAPTEVRWLTRFEVERFMA